MLIVIIYALINLFSYDAKAADFWIQAVGIDETNAGQNHTNFYAEADEFLKTCGGSRRSPECTLFVNEDRNLQYVPQAVQNLNMRPNAGPASKEKVLAALRDAVKRARPRDQIVFSLVNHGAPSEDRQGNSCVFLTSTESICSNEVEEILKQAQKGVRIFVNGDACFSGAFANLAKIGACALTASDQLNVGNGSTRFWGHLNSIKASRLKDLMVPMSDGTRSRLSSQTILHTLCEDARDSVKAKEIVGRSLVSLDSLRLARDVRCELETPLQAPPASSRIASLREALNSASCEEMKLPPMVCEAKARFVNSKDNPNFEKLDREVQDFSEGPVRLHSLIIDKTKNLPPSSPVVFALYKEFLKTEFPSAQTEMSTAEAQIFERYVSELRPVIAKFLSDRVAKKAEILALFKELQSDSSYQDLVILNSCLADAHYSNNPMFSGPNPNGMLGRVARSSRKIHFNQNDYEQAVRCENEIRF